MTCYQVSGVLQRKTNLLPTKICTLLKYNEQNKCFHKQPQIHMKMNVRLLGRICCMNRASNSGN